MFIWDGAVKVISRSSTLVIGISSEPCCQHFVALHSTGSAEDLSGEPMGTVMCLWNKKRIQNLMVQAGGPPRCYS